MNYHSIEEFVKVYGDATLNSVKEEILNILPNHYTEELGNEEPYIVGIISIPTLKLEDEEPVKFFLHVQFTVDKSLFPSVDSVGISNLRESSEMVDDHVLDYVNEIKKTKPNAKIVTFK